MVASWCCRWYLPAWQINNAIWAWPRWQVILCPSRTSTIIICLVGVLAPDLCGALLFWSAVCERMEYLLGFHFDTHKES